MYFYGYRQHQPHAFVNKLKYYLLTGPSVKFVVISLIAREITSLFNMISDKVSFS